MRMKGKRVLVVIPERSDANRERNSSHALAPKHSLRGKSPGGNRKHMTLAAHEEHPI